MNILVVGSGGREHALCHFIAKSPMCTKLFCAPGNAGILDTAICVKINILDIHKLVSFALSEKVELVVIGPEAPLVAGLTDSMIKAGIQVFGPTKKAAQIEGSKAFMKGLCSKYGIPSAAYKLFQDPNSAKEFAKLTSIPIVVKANGLAAGKGVFICENVSEAFDAIDYIMIDRVFGESGSEVIIEEFLEGEEVSFFALVSGNDTLPLISVQDHKKALDGDNGPNTGGMGAYSPTSVVNNQMENLIMEKVIRPTVNGMVRENIAYCGVLFAGLMITDRGPQLIEYNCRFGDPECQTLMARLISDPVEMLLATAQGRLQELKNIWSDETAITVILATKGYPGSYARGSEIKGLVSASRIPGVTIFHSGTCLEKDKILADGGRVLGVTATAKDLFLAQSLAYQAAKNISWPEGFYRKDIGWRELARK